MKCLIEGGSNIPNDLPETNQEMKDLLQGANQKKGTLKQFVDNPTQENLEQAKENILYDADDHVSLQRILEVEKGEEWQYQEVLHHYLDELELINRKVLQLFAIKLNIKHKLLDVFELSYKQYDKIVNRLKEAHLFELVLLRNDVLFSRRVIDESGTASETGSEIEQARESLERVPQDLLTIFAEYKGIKDQSN